MSYFSPVSPKKLIASVDRFKRFAIIGGITILILLVSMYFFKEFYSGKWFWTWGSVITIFSVIANRYFDIKKTANKGYDRIDLPNTPQPERGIVERWLCIEKVISYLWIVGTAFLIASKWVD